MAKRRWTDAPYHDRCGAPVTLRDGTTADCGRRRQSGKLLCWQHYRKWLRSMSDPKDGHG